MKKLYYLFTGFLFALLAVCTLNAQPINPNGGFEEGEVGEKTGTDITGWTLYSEGGSSTIFEVVDYELIEGVYSIMVQLTTLGTNPWDIQIVNEIFTVEPVTEYRYSVWAKAGIAGPVLDLTIGNPAFAEFGRSQVTLTDEWQEYTFTFTTTADADTARAPIHFGESANSSFTGIPIFIDNLQITKTSSVGVEEENQVPLQFSLSQNYPNPFNPATNFGFRISNFGLASLKIYDVLGNEVATLVNEEMEPGDHTINFNASGLASGVYYYTLRSGDFTSTKKMVLLR